MLHDTSNFFYRKSFDFPVHKKNLFVENLFRINVSKDIYEPS